MVLPTLAPWVALKRHYGAALERFTFFSWWRAGGTASNPEILDSHRALAALIPSRAVPGRPQATPPPPPDNPPPPDVPAPSPELPAPPDVPVETAPPPLTVGEETKGQNPDASTTITDLVASPIDDVIAAVVS